MTYKLIKSPTTKKYSVVELSTNKVMFQSEEYKPAQQIYRFYKDGGGFAGDTPSFIYHGNFRPDFA